MKIAVITNIFPTVSETFITNEITGLIDLGHEVNIFAFSEPADKKKIHEAVVKYDLLKRTRYFNIPGNRIQRALRGMRAFLKIIFYKPSALKKCFNLKKYTLYQALNNLLKLEPFLNEEYDVVHCHFGPNALEFLFLRNILDIKLITSFHGYDISKVPQERGQDCYQELFNKGDLFLPASLHFKNRLLDLDCPEQKIKIHYAGIDLGNFDYQQRVFNFSDRIHVLTLARLVEKKGIHYIILAMRDLLKKYKNIKCTIIGNGKQKSELQKLAQEFDQEGTIRFLGSLTHREILKYLYDSDIFILPSITSHDGDQEGIPNALKEAMATGIPVISTYHGGIPELIQDGQSGFLVKERDVKGLIEKVEYIVEHPLTCTEIGRTARSVVELNFSKEILNEELEKIYEDILTR